MLYIFNNSESGLFCETVDRADFDNWVKEHTDNIKPECQPMFASSMPTEMTDPNVFFIIDGEPVIPKPVIVAKAYILP